jgi:hypothetical protein
LQELRLDADTVIGDGKPPRTIFSARRDANGGQLVRPPVLNGVADNILEQQHEGHVFSDNSRQQLVSHASRTLLNSRVKKLDGLLDNTVCSLWVRAGMCSKNFSKASRSSSGRADPRNLTIVRTRAVGSLIGLAIGARWVGLHGDHPSMDDPERSRSERVDPNYSGSVGRALPRSAQRIDLSQPAYSARNRRRYRHFCNDIGPAVTFIKKPEFWLLRLTMH